MLKLCALVCRITGYQFNLFPKYHYHQSITVISKE